MYISIITPVYHGNKYLNRYMNMIKKASDRFGSEENKLEVVLVNDSPEKAIEFDKSIVNGFAVNIIENSKNSGIHASRVNGIKKCSGEYVIFLDQDDIISENCLVSQAECVEAADVCLGNGILEYNNEKRKIFANRFSQNFAAKEWPYIWIRDFIVSPGHCLIKKSAIPDYWMNNILTSNGTDDYLLWLLMFNEACSFSCNYKCVYMHCDTGSNFSSDREKMFESTKELLEILSRCPDYNKSVLKLIKRRIYYKYQDRTNKGELIKASLKNLDVLFVNIYYKLVWRGGVTK